MYFMLFNYTQKKCFNLVYDFIIIQYFFVMKRARFFRKLFNFFLFFSIVRHFFFVPPNNLFLNIVLLSSPRFALNSHSNKANRILFNWKALLDVSVRNPIILCVEGFFPLQRFQRVLIIIHLNTWKWIHWWNIYLWI